MTSEAHYAGPQPADATPGGPTPEGFPPDSDGHRVSGRASAQPPADGFPTSYAPPPPATPNGGSPFVVPAVSAFGHGPEISGGRRVGTSYGSARVPQPDGMRMTGPTDDPPRGSSTSGAPPFRPVTGSAPAFPSPVPGGAAPSDEPRSAWAPAPAAQQSSARPDVSPPQWTTAAPLPQRNPATPPELVEFDGFAAGNAARGGAPESADPGRRDDVDSGTGRPPGISAFGDQRVRVPGATLAEMPDAPESVRAGLAAESAGFPARPVPDGNATDAGFPSQGIANGAFPTRRGDSGGVPLRSPAGAETEFPQPAGELPIRSQQAPYGAPPADQSPRFDTPERPPGPVPEPFSAFGSRAAEDAPHPYANVVVPDAPSQRAAVPPAEPSFGHGSGVPAEAFSGNPVDDAPYRRPEPPVSGSGSAPVPMASVSGPTGFGSARVPIRSVSGPAGPPDVTPIESPSDVQGASAPVSAGPGSRPSDPTDMAGGVPGSPLVESRNGSVPQPRDPAERPAPAVGSARPVTASAAVPSASRVAPVELPPPSAVSQARVYGRPVQTDAEDNYPPEESRFQAAGDDEQPALVPRSAPHSGAAPSPSGNAFQAPFVEREWPDDGRDLGAFRPPAFPAPAGGDRNGGGSAGTPAYGPQPGEDQHRPTDLGSAGTPGNAHGRVEAPTYPAQPIGDPNSPVGFGPVGFGSPAYPNQPDPNAPQSPARATARATASARVAPPHQPAGPAQHQPAGPPPHLPVSPPPHQPAGPPPHLPVSPPPHQPAGPRWSHSGQPFNELTTDVAGRGGVSPFAPEQYSEHTTDVAGRQQPYVPAAALPAYPPPGHPGGGDRSAISGAFAPRGTVTPPSPEDTTSWPGVEQDQGRFDMLKSGADAAAAKPETPHVRMLPVLLAVVVGAGLMLGLVFGIVYLVAGNSSRNAGFSVNTGDCVKKSGEAAVKADCSDAASYEVVSMVDDKSQCADPQQPYVVNPTSDGKTKVLCLKPHS